MLSQQVGILSLFLLHSITLCEYTSFLTKAGITLKSYCSQAQSACSLETKWKNAWQHTKVKPSEVGMQLVGWIYCLESEKGNPCQPRANTSSKVRFSETSISPWTTFTCRRQALFSQLEKVTSQSISSKAKSLYPIMTLDILRFIYVGVNKPNISCRHGFAQLVS